MNTNLLQSISEKMDKLASLYAPRDVIELPRDEVKRSAAKLTEILTKAERQRLSQPFPRGRTDAEIDADIELLQKQARILLTPKRPAPIGSTIILIFKAWALWLVFSTVFVVALFALEIAIGR